MPSPYYDNIESAGKSALAEFTERHAAREQALRVSRDVIRLSANAIRAVHRHAFPDAKELLSQASQHLQETTPMMEGRPEIYYAPFLADARKEYCEANLTLALISGTPMPQLQDLGVEASAYLKGMAEVIGELRRFILDSLRKDAAERCEEMMEVMEEIYGLLVTMDFPEGVTGGLRHTTDMMRGALERTRGDLTMALRQRELEKKLTAWEEGEMEMRRTSQEP